MNKRSVFRKISIFVLFTFLFVIVSGCNNGQSNNGTIAPDNASTANAASTNPTNSSSTNSGNGTLEKLKIGVLLPLTGSNAAFGEEAKRGMEIALDMIAERGGIQKKFTLEPIWCDASTADQGMSEAKRLIEIEKVPLIAGTFSTDVSYAASSIAEQAKVVYWETCNPSDDLCARGYNYFFRTNPMSSIEGREIANFLNDNYSKLGVNDPKELKVALVGEDSVYGSCIIRGAEEQLKKLGIQVVYEEQYSMGVTDLSSLVMKLKEAKTDVVITGASLDDGILLHRQSYELGLDVKAIIGTGSSFGSQAFYDAVGPLAEYTLSSNYVMENSPASYAPGMKSFFEQYRKKYNDEPFIASLCLGTCQGILFLAEALETVEVKELSDITGDAIKDAANKLDIPAGSFVSGWGCKFAQPGDRTQGTNVAADLVILMQWQNGKPYQVYPVPSDGISLVLPVPSWTELETKK